MKNILSIFTLLMLSNIAFATPINNEKEFDKYLVEYGKNSAKFQICGEYDSGDIANIGIYFDEILSPKFLKQQIKKYGSQQKAANIAIRKAQEVATQEQHRLVDKGVPQGMCTKEN